ncbi:periplasmic serine protease (ClpP class) [Gynuella sunshinyii YC6258]|uniref:Periplasmic serine protease (ClpP class) n=2 Tax=Gynuella sunshinyii TaxID=1445505 RepID=A0A0C5V7C8_9GAMM|nr:periplasmic serine protease (ClpP class) [Gynuella sunshinyii YC6258]
MNQWDEAETAEGKVMQKQQELEQKQWVLLEKAVLASTKEARKSRIWGIFFKLLTFGYLIAVLAIYLQQSNLNGVSASTGGHVAVVQVRGEIASDSEASADNIISGLRAAFDHPDTKVVVLKINSPGGSPVQSGYVYDEVMRLKALHSDVPVYAVISDTGASGAYYIAAAADYIYADKASIVGSIGVTAVSFGFPEAMQKLGVERRQFTSGEHKAFLDAFAPLKEDEKKLFEALLNNVHQQFIAAVKQGRGERLKDDPNMFSGLFWSGEQALELGLIDGLKTTSQVAREAGYEKIIDFSPKPNPFDQFAEKFGVSIGKGAAQVLGMDSGVALK